MIDPINLSFISTIIIGTISTICYGQKSIELEKSKYAICQLGEARVLKVMGFMVFRR